MAINFPSGPTSGQSFTANSTTWTWNGTSWNVQGTSGTTGSQGPTGPSVTGPAGVIVQGTAPSNTSSLWLDTSVAGIAGQGPTGPTGASVTGPTGSSLTGPTGTGGATGPTGANAANSLTGATLASNVLASSLTSVGTQTTLAVTTTNIGNGINLTYTPPSGSGAALFATGKDTQGGTGYFDFLKITNTTSGATNPNKSFRLSSSGYIEIINSAYSSLLLSLSDGGNLSILGAYQVNGKQAVNGPAFAYGQDPGASVQTITSGSQQKVTFTLKEFDTGNCFASSKFTPNLEGYYQLNSTVRFDGGGTGTGEVMITIWKNGSEYHRGWNSSGTELASSGWFSMSVSTVAYANGSTDYFEVYIQQTSGSNRSVTRGANISWFNGCMIRGA